MIRTNLVVEDGVVYHPEDLDTGHNVVLRQGCMVGRNVKIWSNSVIDADAIVLDNVRIHCNCYIAQRTIIGRGVFVGPGTVITNDRYPMRTDPEVWEPVVIHNNAVIGGGVIICPGVTIGERAMIGAGSVVTKDVPPRQAWAGNPARRLSEGVETRWLLLQDYPGLDEVEQSESGYEAALAALTPAEYRRLHQQESECKIVEPVRFEGLDAYVRLGSTFAVQQQSSDLAFGATIAAGTRQPYPPGQHKTLEDIEASAPPTVGGQPMAMFTATCRWWTTDINDCYMEQSGDVIKCNTPCCPHCRKPIVMVPLDDFLQSMERCVDEARLSVGMALELAHASNLGRQLCFNDWKLYMNVWRHGYEVR